jgi:hypothetical protein
MPSIGLRTSKPYFFDAVLRTLERTSRILSRDSRPSVQLAMLEKYLCNVAGVRSRKHRSPNVGRM